MAVPVTFNVPKRSVVEAPIGQLIVALLFMLSVPAPRSLVSVPNSTASLIFAIAPESIVISLLEVIVVKLTVPLLTSSFS